MVLQAVSSKLELLLAESTYAHSTEERSTNSRQVQALNQEISEMEEYHFNEMKVCTAACNKWSKTSARKKSCW